MGSFVSSLGSQIFCSKFSSIILSRKLSRPNWIGCSSMLFFLFICLSLCNFTKLYWILWTCVFLYISNLDLILKLSDLLRFCNFWYLCHLYFYLFLYLSFSVFFCVLHVPVMIIQSSPRPLWLFLFYYPYVIFFSWIFFWIFFFYIDRSL